MRDGDNGHLVILIIGFALIVTLLVTVVVNASKLFLMRRSLSALADGAAVVAANAVDESALYTGGAAGDSVPLDDTAAAAMVRDYLADYLDATGDADRFPGLQLVDVRASDGVATVRLRMRPTIPFVNAVSSRGAITMEAEASARSGIG
jgi:hypothetical protein